MSAPDLDAPFDYIVAGGGTAGLVIASRLSDDADIRVLAIEAGQDRRDDPLILTPGRITDMLGKSEYDWNFISTPQPHLANRQINQARGKVLGGTSALNFMMLLYPSRADIDNWEKMGNKGWSYDDLAPYFRKFGTTHAPPQAALDVVGLEYHDKTLSGDGPVQISFSEGYNVANGSWVKAFANLGLGMTTDPRTGKALGGFQNPATIDPQTKSRSYAATAYYSDAVRQRKNLVVLTETLVVKILTNKSGGDAVVATGVRIRDKSGQERTISAEREVVLCAGVFQSPQLLELSGIGDRALLEKLGIPVVIDNPNVGERVQDHVVTVRSFEVKDDIPSGDVYHNRAVYEAMVAKYNGTREGPMGQQNIASAYVPLLDGEGIVSPEKKKVMLDKHLAGSASKEYALLRELIEAPDEPVAQYIMLPVSTTIRESSSKAGSSFFQQKEHYLTIAALLNHPFSRGSCHIVSADVTVKPEWDPKYNSHPLDEEILASCVMFEDKLVQTEPFKSVLKENGLRMPPTGVDGMEKARAVVRTRTISNFHVSGSCAMLPAELGGVVNERLVVHGTRNLRVIDASVFPLEPLGNIQSTVYAVAEKGADLIKQDRAAADALPSTA